jgi:hypothetical protein
MARITHTFPNDHERYVQIEPIIANSNGPFHNYYVTMGSEGGGSTRHEISVAGNIFGHSEIYRMARLFVNIEALVDCTITLADPIHGCNITFDQYVAVNADVLSVSARAYTQDETPCAVGAWAFIEFSVLTGDTVEEEMVRKFDFLSVVTSIAACKEFGTTLLNELDVALRERKRFGEMDSGDYYEDPESIELS